MPAAPVVMIMERDHLGLCPPRLVTDGGVVADVPFLIPQQGVVLSADWAGVMLAVLPVGGSEDPRFGHLLTRSGLYRIEDASGRIARVGQGTILDRIRRHRAAPVVLAWRLVAVVPRPGSWSFEERCYLESRWAAFWRARGHALAASTFMTRFKLDESQRAALERVLDQIIELESLAKRLFDGDPLDEFYPALANDGRERLKGPAHLFRTFPAGTLLEYQGGGVDARAKVLRRSVLLEANSTVCLSVGRSVGAVFYAQHREFLTETGTVELNEHVGRTIKPFECATAAAAIKRVTGGRVHNASKWQMRVSGSAHASGGTDETET